MTMTKPSSSSSNKGDQKKINLNNEEGGVEDFDFIFYFCSFKLKEK